MSTMPPSLAHAVSARAPRRTRYRIYQAWAPAPRAYRWRAVAARVPTMFDGLPLMAVPPIYDVEESENMTTWDEAAAWCDAHWRGLL